MTKNNLLLLVTVVALLLIGWLGLERWLGDVDVNAPAPVAKVEAPVAPAVSDKPSATLQGYALEFVVVLLACSMLAVSGVQNFSVVAYRLPAPSNMRSISGSAFTSGYVPPPANGNEFLLRVGLLMAAVYLLVKLPLFWFFAYDTARLFSNWL